MWHERPENAGKVGRLRKMFKNTKNDEIMLKLNISFGTLHRTARSSGSARCSSRSLCFERLRITKDKRESPRLQSWDESASMFFLILDISDYGISRNASDRIAEIRTRP